MMERNFVTFVSFCRLDWRSLTEDNQENEGFFRQKLLSISKRNFVTFVSFCLICSRQDHPRYAVLEDRLMEIDEQSDRDIQQLHVTEELRFAERMQSLDSF